MADCMSEWTLNEQMESLAEILPPIESNIDDYGESDRDKVENFSLSSPEIIYIYIQSMTNQLLRRETKISMYICSLG